MSPLRPEVRVVGDGSDIERHYLFRPTLSDEHLSQRFGHVYDFADAERPQVQTIERLS
jgi:hypothetical protein